MSLLGIIPCAHPVRLCGRVYLCRERRLEDMAYTEALALAARGTEPPPWTRSDLDPDVKRRAIREAFDLAEKGEDLPSWGSPEVTAILLGTEIGRREYLRRVLVDSQLTPDQIIALDEEMGPDDWAAILEATGPHDALLQADRAILTDLGILDYVQAARVRHLPPSEPGQASGFHGAIAAVCKQLGCQPASLAGWTVSELAFVCNEGRPPTLDYTCPIGVARKEWDPKVMVPREAWFKATDEPANVPVEPTAPSDAGHPD